MSPISCRSQNIVKYLRFVPTLSIALYRSDHLAYSSFQCTSGVTISLITAQPGLKKSASHPSPLTHVESRRLKSNSGILQIRCRSSLVAMRGIHCGGLAYENGVGWLSIMGQKGRIPLRGLVHGKYYHHSRALKYGLIFS